MSTASQSHRNVPQSFEFVRETLVFRLQLVLSVPVARLRARSCCRSVLLVLAGSLGGALVRVFAGACRVQAALDGAL